ncbi:hypothetical protein [Amycolatopsis thermophila]|uniref:DUF5666 domain-containing protein n=1 Tax=Amycolatopsis thermophila TaxID=206084 RepID=A0ABU0ETJ5_9PSEU|nr:hypothetical protein [Amycolatopsis thermophila]MDQ0378631.1 hypothetical protein [Amycolatopsis thermophila]
MSTEPTTTEAPAAAWGDPQPPAPKWSGTKTAIAAAVAVVIAAVGGVAIYLGTSSGTDQQAGGFPGGGRTGQLGGVGGTASILREALHGDFTVSADGGYAVERFQSGEATAVSANSITVRSRDGYTQSYVIDSSTEKAGNPAAGSSVTVLAKVSGDTATATSITDGSSPQGGVPRAGQGGFPGRSQN